MNIATNLKAKGTSFLSLKKYYEATLSYKQAVDIIDNEGLTSHNINGDTCKKILRGCLLNIALVNLKNDYNNASYTESLQCCNRVLKIFPNDAKALYRRGGSQGLTHSLAVEPLQEIYKHWSPSERPWCK